MKKNLLVLFLALVMLLALTACGGAGDQVEEKPQQPEASQDNEQPNATEEDGTYVFVSGDAVVGVNADMADVLAALGEPVSYFEAESCAFHGLDKTYTYGGFIITTRPDGEKDFVNSILLTDDSVTTKEGVYIGSAKADVIAAYGETEDMGVLLAYTKGDCTLNFIMENDKVSSIEYLPG